MRVKILRTTDKHYTLGVDFITNDFYDSGVKRIYLSFIFFAIGIYIGEKK